MNTQEVNWRTVAQAIADLKFEGYFAHEFVPVRDPIEPLAVIVPSPRFRNPSRAPPPATVRTLAISGMALVDGSSATVAGFPGEVGVTATATRFSFSESAETLAA